MDVQKIKEIFSTCKGIDFQLTKDIENYTRKDSELNSELKSLEDAQIFLQKIAQETQEHLRFQIEDIVNLALETCFPGEYIFQIKFEISRGKTEAELVFLDQKTQRQIDPMNASGGGVVDLTTFALRIACYALERGTDNVIILDEPMKFVSKDLLDRLCEVIKVLSKKMNLQIIMVTHENKFIEISDKIFEVKKDSAGISKITVRE